MEFLFGDDEGKTDAKVEDPAHFDLFYAPALQKGKDDEKFDKHY